MARQGKSLRHLWVAALAVLMLAAGLVVPAHSYPRPGATEIVSVASDGTQQRRPSDRDPILGSGFAQSPHNSAISANGRYVAFVSSADNLVPGDTNEATDVFVHDRTAGKTERVSVSSDGAQGIGFFLLDPQWGSYDPAISANGRFVAFRSWATNLVSGDTNLHSDVFVHDRKARRTERASLTRDGTQSHETVCTVAHQEPYYFGWEVAISGSGRHVAFSSRACDIVEGADNGTFDVYVNDRRTGKSEIISKTSESGVDQGLEQFSPSINASGRFVSFRGLSSVPGELHQAWLHDRKTGKTDAVSIASNGIKGRTPNGLNFFPDGSSPAQDSVEMSSQAISADGRYVAFTSYFNNLVPTDTERGAPIGGRADVFVHDNKTGRTERVSVTSSGEEANSDSAFAIISRDGRYVVFTSWADNLEREGATFDPGLLNEIDSMGLFVHDRKLGTTEPLRLTPAGGQAHDNTCSPAGHEHPGIDHYYRPSVSRGGRFVSFDSCLADLVKNDRNPGRDVFVRDRGDDVGAGRGGQKPGGTDDEAFLICLPNDTCIPDPTSYIASTASADGPSLPSGEEIPGADLIRASAAYRPDLKDILLRVDVESMALPTLGGLGATPVLYGFDLVAAGTRHQVRVQRGGSDATPSSQPVSFGLFRKESGGFSRVASLRGGYGATGEQVVVALPLEHLGLEAGGKVAGLRAFTAMGTYDLGVTRILDRIDLSRR